MGTVEELVGVGTTAHRDCNCIKRVQIHTTSFGR
jgi:hypothetical protein